jgi:hypothetical protein
MISAVTVWFLINAELEVGQPPRRHAAGRRRGMYAREAAARKTSLEKSAASSILSSYSLNTRTFFNIHFRLSLSVLGRAAWQSLGPNGSEVRKRPPFQEQRPQTSNLVLPVDLF